MVSSAVQLSIVDLDHGALAHIVTPNHFAKVNLDLALCRLACL